MTSQLYELLCHASLKSTMGHDERQERAEEVGIVVPHERRKDEEETDGLIFPNELALEQSFIAVSLLALLCGRRSVVGRSWVDRKRERGEREVGVAAVPEAEGRRSGEESDADLARVVSAMYSSTCQRSTRTSSSTAHCREDLPSLASESCSVVQDRSPRLASSSMRRGRDRLGLAARRVDGEGVAGATPPDELEVLTRTGVEVVNGIVVIAGDADADGAACCAGEARAGSLETSGFWSRPAPFSCNLGVAVSSLTNAGSSPGKSSSSQTRQSGRKTSDLCEVPKTKRGVPAREKALTRRMKEAKMARSRKMCHFVSVSGLCAMGKQSRSLRSPGKSVSH